MSLTAIDPLAEWLSGQPLLLKSIRTTATVGLGMMAGVALCQHIWIIPGLLKAKHTSTKTIQFRHAVDLSLRLLSPCGRTLTMSLAFLALVFSRSKDQALVSQAKYVAAAMGSVIMVPPWEVWMIFPSNDRLYALADQLEESGKESFGDARDGQVDKDLSEWRFWHTGRVVFPAVACFILVWSVLSGNAI